jgi:hypothetical protein
MNGQLLIHGLDTRSLRSLVEGLEKCGAKYSIEKEPPDGTKHAMPLDVVRIIMLTGAAISVISAWLASRGKDVEVEASAGLTSSKLRWKIKSERRTAEEIERELQQQFDALSPRSPKKKPSAGKKVQNKKVAGKKSVANKSTRVSSRKKTAKQAGIAVGPRKRQTRPRKKQSATSKKRA